MILQHIRHIFIEFQIHSFTMIYGNGDLFLKLWSSAITSL